MIDPTGDRFFALRLFERSPLKSDTAAATRSLSAAAQSSRSSNRIDESKTTPAERQAEPVCGSHRAIVGHVSFSVREPMKRPMCPLGTSFFSIRPLGVPTRFSAAKTCSLVVMSSLSPARR
jgi:hypothetical protein